MANTASNASPSNLVLLSSKTAPSAIAQPVLGVFVLRLDRSVRGTCDSLAGIFRAQSSCGWWEGWPDAGEVAVAQAHTTLSSTNGRRRATAVVRKCNGSELHADPLRQVLVLDRVVAL